MEFWESLKTFSAECEEYKPHSETPLRFKYGLIVIIESYDHAAAHFDTRAQDLCTRSSMVQFWAGYSISCPFSSISTMESVSGASAIQEGQWAASIVRHALCRSRIFRSGD